jgi:hypothetical protein
MILKTENNFITYFKNKVIIKNKQQIVEFYIADISNVRIFKKRNLYPNIIAFNLMLGITSTSIVSPNSNSSIAPLVNIFLFSVLFIVTFFLKNYNHKLLINKGKYGFSEITFEKKNIQNANKFLNDFNSNQWTC